MIRPNQKMHEESMRLYRDWLEAGRPMSEEDFVEQYASDEFKEYQRILGEELEKAHAEGLIV